MPQALVVDRVLLGVDILSRNIEEPKLRNGRGDYQDSDREERRMPSRCRGGYEDEYSAFGDSGVGKMYSAASPRDNARTYGSPVSTSPMSRKQAILQRQSLDKYTNISDGESDSGSSTLTETRHELAPEIEYSWECPSGLSLLLELMTQSPRRNSGRDVTEMGCGARSPDKSRNEFAPTDVLAEKYVLYQKKPEISESKPDSVRSVARCDKLCNRFEDVTGEFTGGNILQREEHQINQIYRSVNTREATVIAEDAQAYEYEEAHDQKYYYAQRKISFDSGKYRSCNSEYQRPESPIEEPIDYSQLSSRRREIVTQTVQAKLELQDLSSCQPEEESFDAYRQRESELSSDVDKRPLALVPKYEFILSPKMDNNGNLILHQSQRSASTKSIIGQDHLKRKANDSIQALSGAKYVPCEFKRDDGQVPPQSSLTSTPPSCEVPEYERRGSPVSSVQVVSSEPTKHSMEKMDVPYHPKLKYLMAASQYAKSKAKMDEFENEVQQKAPSILFSQEISTESKMLVHGLEEERLDHASSLSVPSTVHSTNVFILNTGSSLFTSEAPRGSQLSHQTNQIIEIHPHHLKSSSTLHISVPAIGSSDLMVQEQYQNSPESPSPADQPLSPASLQDQQSTLSDLLFSANRKPGVDPYACADCGKRYSTSSNLARHRQTHRSVCDKKARKCPHCEKVYVSMPAYSMHVRTHNQGCECPHCGKKFSRPWLLQGHIRTHTGEKPFGCPQCGKSFADKSNLRAHIQTHSTDKPYVCGRCGKAFALKSYLYKHEESSCMRGQRFRN